MITGKELAEKLGCSDSYARRLFRDGCPRASVAEAVEWVNAAGKRPGSRNKSGGVPVPPVPQNGGFVKPAIHAPPPPVAPAPAPLPVAAPVPVAPADPATPPEFDSVLGRIRVTEREMYRLLQEAIKCGASGESAGVISRFAEIHAKAAATVEAAEKAHRKALVEARKLLDAEEAVKILFDISRTLRIRLETMPRVLAAKVAPHDPIHAEDVLEAWVQATITEVEKAVEAGI